VIRGPGAARRSTPRPVALALALAGLFAWGCGSGQSGSAKRASADAGSAAASARASTVRADSARARLASTRAAADTTPVVLFLGNSLTAGLGLLPEQAYPALVQAKIDSAGLDFRVVNAGVSGATSADGVRLVGGYLDRPVVAVVLELGANDMLRGQDLGATRANLQAIIDSVRARRPGARIVIAGMQAPPNLGSDYTRSFRAIYPALARRNDAALVPFLLAGVAADTALNQADGMHPNAAGEKIVAENVWEVLEPVLRRIEAARGAG
jgi:acyl-CoA thioesterase I